jgi:hypothetical protein
MSRKRRLGSPLALRFRGSNFSDVDERFCIGEKISALAGVFPPVDSWGNLYCFMSGPVFSCLVVTSRLKRSARSVVTFATRPIQSWICETILDDDILANAVAQVPQTLLERFDEMELLLSGRGRKVTHSVDSPCRLLRTRSQRPRRRRAADKRDEPAPLHCQPQDRTCHLSGSNTYVDRGKTGIESTATGTGPMSQLGQTRKSKRATVKSALPL